MYLAPEELEYLEKGDKDMNCGWRANCFVFGLLILGLMNMQHVNELFDFSACIFSFTKMEELISYARNFYSERLINITKSLLREKPEQRLTFRGLLNRMNERHELENKNVDITLM